MATTARSLEPLTADVLYQGFRGLLDQFDDSHGGTGLQPKFPQPMIYEFLLRYHLRTGEPEALEMVELTLERMASGGIHDQLGGGFHRYSTDIYWLVPHFEKMLYDNALLASLYLHVFQVTGKPLYRRIVEETLDYVLREMADSLGGFHSAQDADSEGVEGKFFVWRPEDISDLLGREDGEIFNRIYGVTRVGNFEGYSILHVADDIATVAHDSGLSEDDLESLLSRSRAKLLDARSLRVAPERDDKVLTAWNGLMLRALAEAAAVLGRSDYAEKAKQNANFLLNTLRREGRLLRMYRAGEAKLNGYLEDYASLIDGLIAMHELTFETRWLDEAVSLGYAMVELFWDEASGQFYDTGHDHEELIVRPREISDNAVPSGSSMAAAVLLRLAVITGDADLERRAVTALRSARQLMTAVPAGAGHWLCALDFYLSTAKEIAVVGDRGSIDTQALVAEVYRHYLPNRVFLGRGSDGPPLPGIPLLEGREQIEGKPTVYVCQNYVCNLPVNEPEALARELAES